MIKGRTGESASLHEMAQATLIARAAFGDDCEIHGFYTAECYDSDGNLKWRDVAANVVCTLGKNFLLDSGLAGSAYTVTGPFMGLISSTSFSAVSAADTMSSHAGWLEAGNAHLPNYSGTRGTCAWSAASGGAKALSAPLNFTMTAAGTVKGAFINYGPGAVNTIDDTNGTLFSAGLFTGGDKVVGIADVLAVSYSVSV